MTRDEMSEAIAKVMWGKDKTRCTTLDDIREAELLLIGLVRDSKGNGYPISGYHTYVANLYRVVNHEKPGAYYHWSSLGDNEAIVSASFEQRAEAILRTLNLWTE